MHLVTVLRHRGRRYRMVTIQEFCEIYATAPSRLVRIRGEWCVPLAARPVQ